jgi:hypothetical protein
MAATERAHSPTPEELMAHLDGESSAEAHAAIEAHLANCSECQGVAAGLRRVSESAAAWNVEEAPATLRAPGTVRSQRWRLPAFSWRPSYLLVSVGGVGVTILLVTNLAIYVKRATVAPMLSAPTTVVRRDGAVDHVSPQGQGGMVGGGGGGLPSARKAEIRESMPQPASVAPAPRRPLVIRTATLRIVAKDFNDVRSAVESIVGQAGGFIDQLTATAETGAARTMRGTLRVPADRLAAAVRGLRQIGQVVEDTQGSEDVTDQIVDLDARVANARATEQRLNDILKNRTGKLSDVLDVERELARVRLEIERMDAERANIGRRVTFAAITIEITEERKAGLESGPLPLNTRLRVAAADGLESALESAVGTLLFALRAGPALLLWFAAAAIFWSLARRIRRARSA